MRDEAEIVAGVLVPRALVVWVLTRSAVAMVSLMAGLPFETTAASAVVMIVLTGLLGFIDIRMRGERLLWANLGVRPSVLFAVYAAIAIPGELALWVALR